MAIQFIVGKPGSGKSFFGTHCLVNDLVYTSRTIVTNLPLKLDGLNEHLAKNFPKFEDDINERIVMLEHEDVFEFYRFRSGGLILRQSPDAEVKEGGRRLKIKEHGVAMYEIFEEIKSDPSYVIPCSYHIDEAQDYFDSRQWADIGRGITYYASKHRHLHDEVCIYTQDLDMVEKRMRKLAQCYHTLRNQYKESFGIFSRPGCFVRKTYLSIPGPNVIPVEVTKMKLSSGIGDCYNTVGALGLGDSPEEPPRRRKLPWWMLYVFGGLAVLAALALVRHLPNLVQASMTGFRRDVTTKVEQPDRRVAKAESALSPAGFTVPESVGLENRVTVRGVLNRGDKYVVTLSDGRVYTELDSQLELITDYYVQISSIKYPYSSYAKPRQANPVEPLTPVESTVESGGIAVAPGVSVRRVIDHDGNYSEAKERRSEQWSLKPGVFAPKGF